MKIFKQSGQTLIEVMVAIGIGSIILSAIVVVVISSLNNENFNINQNQSTKLAEEGLDVMRNLSSDWNTLVTYNTSASYCLSKDSIIPNSPVSCPAIDDKFKREILFEWDNSKCDPNSNPLLNLKNNVSITSAVRWADGKCLDTNNQYCHKVEVSSCFFRPNTGLYP